jgi:hypothetical protein
MRAMIDNKFEEEIYSDLIWSFDWCTMSDHRSYMMHSFECSNGRARIARQMF